MNTLNEKLIRKYVNETIKSGLAERLLNLFDNRMIVSEGLTMTYSLNRIKKIITQKYNLKSIGCNFGYINKNRANDFTTMLRNANSKTDKTTRDNNSWMEVSLTFLYGIKCDKNVISDIIHTMDVCGWYFAGLIDINNLNTYKTFDNTIYQNYIKRPCKLLFYPKFNEEVKTNNINKVCYHICPSRVVDKIMKQGLTPRNNGRVAAHPERVYLFLNKPRNWKQIANNFRQSGNNERYTLLSINLTDMINKGVKFYFDANTMTDNPAIYTLEPISPSCINVEDEE